MNPYRAPNKYAGIDITNIDISVTLPPSGILKTFAKLNTNAKATQSADITNFFKFVLIILYYTTITKYFHLLKLHKNRPFSRSYFGPLSKDFTVLYVIQKSTLIYHNHLQIMKLV